jgi:uncharacterized protein (TIRG00374 family)
MAPPDPARDLDRIDLTPDDPHGPTAPDDPVSAAVAEPSSGLAWGPIIRRCLFLGMTVLVLYLLAPKLGEVFGSWETLGTIHPLWIVAMIAADATSYWFVSLFTHLVLPSASRFGITCAQLAGHALSTVVPGGAATGGAVEYKMLVRAGAQPTKVGSAMAVQGIVLTAVVFALPVFALPAIIFGAGAPGGLLQTAFVGFGVFAVLLAFGAAALLDDRPVHLSARVVVLAARVIRKHLDPDDLTQRLLVERDEVRGRLGQRWLAALVYSFGKWLLEYVVLVLALEAVGVHPRPSLVLLAYTASALLSMIPITPGGLGFVEAGLVGTLALAGVAVAPAAAATLLYRLVTYWLPLPAGLIAWLLARRHYGGDRVSGAVAPASP